MTLKTQLPSEGLRTSYFHRQWGDSRVGDWSLTLVRGKGVRQICWSFTLDTSASALPRGYLDSVRQRFELASGLPSFGPLLREGCIGEGKKSEVVTDSMEGEPLTEYLKRSRPSLRVTLGLLGGLVTRLRGICDQPRILSNIVPEDFLVCNSHGVSVVTELHPVFSILREEVSKSEFEIASFWGDFVARIHGAARDGWQRECSEYDPLAHRTFRKLLKSLQAGRDLEMKEVLEELQRCLRREIDCQRPPADELAEIPASSFGPLRAALLEELAIEYPEKLATGESRISPFSSAFVVPLIGEELEEEARQGALLPPEGWFYDSLIGGVNQKMATPFLSNHPNTQRTRALLCEEGFTLVITDRNVGMPLPSLLELKKGMGTEDALRVAGKIRRALDQFESAEFPFEFETPWQIEVYPLNEGDSGAWSRFISRSCAEWPAWDVRIRVEIPTEAIVETAHANAWQELLERLNGKVFPALLVWLLEWRRLEWAAQENALEREPLSWDPRFDSLFAAASEHFEPLNPLHRERLLSLLAEGYESGDPSPEN